MVLNIDNDHLDYYGSMGELKFAFKRFALMTQFMIFANADDKNTVIAILQQHTLAAILFQNDVLTLGVEAHFHTVVGQIILDGQIQLLCLFGAQMAAAASTCAKSTAVR